MKKFLDFMNESKIHQIFEVFVIDIEDKTLKNEFFREVLYTGKHLQLAVMTIPVGEEIGEEIHFNADQFIRVESGLARFVLNGVSHTVSDGFAVVVDQGTKHNVINVGDAPLKLYMVYSAQQHEDKEVDVNRPNNG